MNAHHLFYEVLVKDESSLGVALYSEKRLFNRSKSKQIPYNSLNGRVIS